MIKETCVCCKQTIERKAKCSDCKYLEYYSAPDAWYCAKGKSGTVVCKEFKLK